MKLRAITVDDEDLARQILREYLQKTGDVEIVAECANGFEAVGTLRHDLNVASFLQILPQDLASKVFIVHGNSA